MKRYLKSVEAVKKLSERKIKNATFGEWQHSIFTLLIILIIGGEILTILYRLFGAYGWYVGFGVFFIFLIFYFATKKAGIGITDKSIVYVIFKHFGYKEKRVYEILEEKIKRITVTKFLNFIFVRMSFISDVGKLEKARFYFSTFYIGFASYDCKKNSLAIYNRLMEIQKKVDKGDF